MKTFEVVTRNVKQVMDEWGKGPEVYGLIHADLGLDANVLFWGGEARAIDFDDSGFGYYVYDLGIALDKCQEDEALPLYREALLEGYTLVRPLSKVQIQSLDLFLAASCVYISLWCAAVAHLYPKYNEELNQRMEGAFKLVKRFLAKC